ncbi:hypothetical protein D3C87_1490180 [compost metagenome]
MGLAFPDVLRGDDRVEGPLQLEPREDPRDVLLVGAGREHPGGALARERLKELARAGHGLDGDLRGTATEEALSFARELSDRFAGDRQVEQGRDDVHAAAPSRRLDIRFRRAQAVRARELAPDSQVQGGIVDDHPVHVEENGGER